LPDTDIQGTLGPGKAPRGGGSDNDVWHKEANYSSIQAITLMLHRDGITQRQIAVVATCKES